MLTKIGDDKLCNVLCFPRYEGECCRYRVEELNKLGVVEVYSFGDVVLWNGVRVVGKGHASVVVLANHVKHGLVALKVRRVDSKRISMKHEGMLLEKALGSKFVPRVYSYTDDFLLREFVDGCTLEKLLEMNRYNRKAILESFKNLLIGSLELDLIGIDLVEVAKPLKQVVYRCCNPENVVFIDFESGRISFKPLNMTKVLNFIIYGNIGGIKVRDIIGLNEVKIRRLLELARLYKSSLDKGFREKLVRDILEMLGIGVD